MILKKLKILDIERLGDTDEGVEAGISNDSLPFMFEILSTQFYSNAIGSIIREITSNCFDSHIEAGVDDPVIVRKGHDEEEGYYIEFQDFGVGLSVDRIYKVYMNYFSSTKRGTNDLIGGFGLGSKTPLSYSDYFYITTIYDGLKYEYIYHKGETRPTIESLKGYDEVEEEYFVETITDETGEEVELEEPIRRIRIKKIPTGTPTEERNGTTIKVLIKDSSDLAKFQKELAIQLSYFDNVYFEGFNVPNDYEIYEGKNFIFRSDIDQYHTEIHICIGKVRYAIDFNLVDIKREYRGIPVGIKFEIGELQITPNRESIRYNEESIKLIHERLLLAVQEITDMYNKQNPEIETLEQYNRSIKEEAKIVFDSGKGHAINLWSYSGMSKSFRFKPLSELGLKKSPAQLFFGWERVGSISGGIFIPRSYGNTISNDFILNQRFIIMDKETKLSKYTDLFISEQLISYSFQSVEVLRKKPTSFFDMERNLEIRNAKRENNKALTIYKYNKIIEEIVKKKSLGNYKEFRPTNEWIAAYKKRIKEESLAFRRKMEKKVFIRDVGRDRGREIPEHELNTRTGILVYGFKEDKDKLRSIYSIVVNNVHSIRNISYGRKEKAFMVIQIARAIETSIIGAKKTIYWEDFIKTKFFAKIYSAQWLYSMVTTSGIRDFEELKTELIPNYSNDIKNLDAIISKYCKEKSVYLDGVIGDTKIKIDPSMVRMFYYLNDKYSKIKIPFQYTIRYVPSNREDRKDYIDYLIYRKVRIKNSFYLKDKKQLEYEANIRTILDTIKGKVKPQLLLTINQNENGNEDSITEDQD